MGAVLLLTGMCGAAAYEYMLLPQTPVTATVTEEVHMEFWSGHKHQGKNIVTLRIDNGPDAGEEAKARFYFASSGEEFKKGDHVSGSLITTRLLNRRTVSDVTKLPKP